MRTQLSHASRALRSGEVIVRFFVRIIVLFCFAAFAGIGFGKSLLVLLWMSTILSAILATVRRELPLADILNHWDEALAYVALCALVEAVNAAAAA
ncbi:MAG: hypothetical protein JO283_11885 [Bradyrhizobium sp.]|nr:hypothetical protein [Bradyrhizobium sp.]